MAQFHSLALEVLNLCLQTSGCIYVKALKGLKGSHRAGQESCYFGRALRASTPPVTYQFLNELCGLVTVRGDCGYTEHQKSGGPESPHPPRAGDGVIVLEQSREGPRQGGDLSWALKSMQIYTGE